jgi:hypothetical protein
MSSYTAITSFSAAQFEQPASLESVIAKMAVWRKSACFSGVAKLAVKLTWKSSQHQLNVT